MLFFSSRCQRQDFTKKTPERSFTKTFAGIPGSSVRLEDSKVSVYLNRLLGGGFKYVLFSLLFGEDFQFD